MENEEKNYPRFSLDEMDNKAITIVEDYVINNFDVTDKCTRNFNMFVVWKCKILQNWKYLISTDILDGMYYELTYNGNKNEWYLDAYKKWENKLIKN